MIGRISRMAVIGMIRSYQICLRPILGANCRFEPGCSDYAVEAVSRHGAGRGSLLAASRILRCNPWHPGGVDPVPARASHIHRDRPFR